MMYIPTLGIKKLILKRPPQKTCCGSHNKIRQAFQQPNSGSIYHVEGILLDEDLELAISPAEKKKKAKARSSWYSPHEQNTWELSLFIREQTVADGGGEILQTSCDLKEL